MNEQCCRLSRLPVSWYGHYRCGLSVIGHQGACILICIDTLFLDIVSIGGDGGRWTVDSGSGSSSRHFRITFTSEKSGGVEMGSLRSRNY